MVNIKRSIIKALGLLTVVGVFVTNSATSYAVLSSLEYSSEVSSEIEVETYGKKSKTSSDVKGDAISSNISTDVAKVLGISTEESEEYNLVFGEELAQLNIIYKSTKTKNELKNQFKDMHEVKTVDLGNSSIIEVVEEENKRQQKGLEKIVEEEKEEKQKQDEQKQDEEEQEQGEQEQEQEQFEQEQEQSEQEQSEQEQGVIFTNVDQSEAMVVVSMADDNYEGVAVTLDPADRDLLERLIMGESGGVSVEAAALVAQTIRDTMVYKGFNSVADVRKALKYSGSIRKQPNENVKQAVEYVFDQGGIVVKHTIFYFYAPARCKSSFHERQQFILESSGHRFFS